MPSSSLLNIVIKIFVSLLTLLITDNVYEIINSFPVFTKKTNNKIYFLSYLRFCSAGNVFTYLEHCTFFKAVLNVILTHAFR